MATLYKNKRKGIWWISYHIKGRRYRFSAWISNKSLVEEKKKDVKLKIIKGEMGIKQLEKNNSQIPVFFRLMKLMAYAFIPARVLWQK